MYIYIILCVHVLCDGYTERYLMIFELKARNNVNFGCTEAIRVKKNLNLDFAFIQRDRQVDMTKSTQQAC